MTRWEHQFLGSDAFPAGLSSLEISQFFTLDPPELAAVRKRRGPNNQLAVALQVGFLKMTGGLLNSTDLIPSAVLEHVGGQLHAGSATPFIASIRALYRKRRRTLFDHQQAAMQVMGFEYFSANAKPHLISLLRREAIDCFDLNELIARARAWVYEHRFVLPTTRNLRSLAVAARKWRDDAVLEEIQGRIDETVRDQWLSRLLAIGDPATGATRMDWLRDGPRSKRPHGLTDQVEKIEFLKGLGADQLAMNLSLAGLQHYARHFSYRKPAALARMSDARFTLEAGCFLVRLAAGDELVVKSLDRLGRRAGELVVLLDEQHRRGVLVRILDMPWLDYSAPIGRFIAQTFAALAELEREQTRERQRGGIEAAKRAGRHLGRPPKLTGAQIKEAERMLQGDRPASEVARLFRVHPKTLKAATRR